MTITNRERFLNDMNYELQIEVDKLLVEKDELIRERDMLAYENKNMANFIKRKDKWLTDSIVGEIASSTGFDGEWDNYI